MQEIFSSEAVQTRSVYLNTRLSRSQQKRRTNGHSIVDVLAPSCRPQATPHRVECTEHGVHVTPSTAAARRISIWKGATAEVILTPIRDEITITHHSDSHLLVFYENGIRSEGATFVDGNNQSTLRDVSGRMTFIPAGHRFYETHVPRRPSRIICIHIDPAAMLQALGCQSHQTPTVKLFFDNGTLREVCRKLATLIENGLDEDIGFLKALGSVVVHELGRLDHSRRHRHMSPRGGLAGWQKAAVSKYIDEHLAESISVKELAKVAKLSNFYFSRAFKITYGMPPYKYLVSRRIDRARNLLVNPAGSIIEIGLDVGFSEASSFSAAFRRITGLTPSEFRKGLI